MLLTDLSLKVLNIVHNDELQTRMQTCFTRSNLHFNTFYVVNIANKTQILKKT